MITGYVSVWKGIICVLPLTAIRGEFWNASYNEQKVVDGFNVIHFSINEDE